MLSLLVAWSLKTTKAGEIKKSEFIDGCVAMSCETLDDLKANLPRLRQTLTTEDSFREFYTFLFNYGKGEQKSIGMFVCLFGLIMIVCCCDSLGFILFQIY